MDRLYVIVRADLPAGLQLAQTGHAVMTFCEEHCDRPENMIVLHARGENDLAKLASALEDADSRVSVFREPDVGNQLTAIAACGENAHKITSSLPLAFRALVAA